MNSAFITSYERDDEIDLDYAQARMYGYGHGRFTSPDPALSSMREEIPQSWNRYVYVLNNPIKFIDPLGLYEFDNTADETQRKNFREGLKKAKDALKQIREIYGKDSEEYLEAKKGVDAYGCEVGTKGCNEKAGTGVLVGTATFEDGSAGSASRTDNNSRVIVRFDGEKLSQKNNFDIVAAIAHEGVHVQDHLNYISSGGKTKVSDYDTERRGYVVTSAIASVLTGGYSMQMNKSYFQMYRPEWGGANKTLKQDVSNVRSERNKEIDRLLAVPKPPNGNGLYGVTREAPGNQFFP